MRAGKGDDKTVKDYNIIKKEKHPLHEEHQGLSRAGDWGGGTGPVVWSLYSLCGGWALLGGGAPAQTASDPSLV